MYHRVFRYALGGATAYVVCDALDELFIYLHCRRIGMRAARGSDELRAEIGIDMRAGPWYNSSLRTSHYGHMASCSFPVEGDRVRGRNVVSNTKSINGTRGCCTTVTRDKNALTFTRQLNCLLHTMILRKWAIAIIMRQDSRWCP